MKVTFLSLSFSERLICSIIILMLSCILAFFSSCHYTKEEKAYTIGFSQCLNIGKDNWRKTMLEEMKRELSFHNNIHFIYKEADGNSQKQISQIDSLVHEHI